MQAVACCWKNPVMLKNATVILLSPNSVPFTKLCMGHQAHSLFVSATPDIAHCPQLLCPPLAPFPGEDSWSPSVNSLNLLSHIWKSPSFHLRLFLAPVNIVPSHPLQDFDPSLWLRDSIHLGISVPLPSWKIPPSTFYFPLEGACLLL